MNLGFNKLNGRYIWIAGIISVTLLAITLYAQNLVTNSAQDGYSVIQKNTRLLQQVSKITRQIQQIESNVLKYTTYLNDETRFNAETDLEQLQVELLSLVEYVHKPVVKNYLHTSPNAEDITNAINNIEKSQHREGYEEIDRYVDNLVVIIDGLRSNISMYFDVMSNVRTRYPGMPYLLDYLAPNNILFSEAVESALQESNMTDAQIRELDKYQYQIVALFQAVRYAWVQKVSWLRVMVSNRMGAFGDPIKSMKRNLVNREIYTAEVDSILDKLEKYKARNLLGLQQEESLATMRLASEKYEEHFNKAISVYLSDNWRADLPILKTVIEPNFKILRETVAKIENVINKNANKGITASLLTANLLTGFIWFFAMSVTALLVTFYFVFNRVIRTPLLNVAQAMEAEARGEFYKLNEVHKVHEIRLLDRAFNYMRNEVHSRQQYLEAIFDNAAEGILTINIDGQIESMNDAGLKLFGLSKESGQNNNIAELIHLYKETELYKIFFDNCFVSIEFEGEVTAKNTNNELFPLLVKVSQMQVGADVLYILIVQDISEQKFLLKNLQHVAEHDALTGLYNRQYYADNLERIINLAHREESYNIVCMFLDLDNFKYVNDTLGHMAGDRLLQEITALLRKRMRKSDLLARIGGDEFSLIFQGIDLDMAVALANEYRQCIEEYQFIENAKIFNIGCSIGLAAMTSEIENKDELLSRADVACHEAKRKGKNCIHVYELSDKQKTDNLYVDMGWSQRIKNALEGNNFVFAKQKICHTKTGAVFAEEYLIRMLDNDKQGLIMPIGFLNSAERFGLMPDIDRWVVEHALEIYAQNIHQSPDDMPCISINLSAKSVGHPEIYDVISDSIQKFAIDPAKIIFEITEDVAISDFPNAIIFLNKLRAMGCATALDDFGAGYSSFSYLKEFPVDYVKIDGSFIIGIENNKLNYALVKAMHDVCSTLNKKTVVEFVENQQALDVLNEIGVDYVQGFYISRPELLDKPKVQAGPVLNESVK